MRALEEERAGREGRGNTTKDLKDIAVKALVDIELEDLTLFKLLRVFERMMRQFDDEQKRPIHQIYTYSYTVESQRDFILSHIKEGKKSDFRQVFGNLENRLHAIITFLALLEMLNRQELFIIQGEGINNFWLTLTESDMDEN